MRARSLLIIIPLIWLLSSAFTQWTGHPWSSNSVTVSRLGKWIERFQKDQNRLPENLAELRTYAYSFGETPELHDSYGERLFYLPLTEEAFVVKSFGRDATENTVLRSRDEAYSHGLIVPPANVKGRIPDESRLHFYQSAFLEGENSPRGPLVASIRTRFRSDAKRLLVQSKDDPQFFMSSFHDNVDEFIWLAGGYDIIFSAQGSRRYEDGVYHWNLRDNSVRNLLPMLREKYFPELKDETKMLISLSHSSDSPDFIYLFALPAPDSGSMDPKEFFRYRNFYALNSDNDFIAERVTADKDFSIFDYPIDHRALLNVRAMEEASPSQKSWAALSLSGEKQALLETWQNFCSDHSNSPSLPYALWWLVSIYNDTYRDILKDQPEKARTLRNYGLEIAEALSALSSAPPYLRAFAEHLKKNLLLSKAADYNVVSTVQDEEEEDEESSSLPNPPGDKNGNAAQRAVPTNEIKD